MSRLSFCRDVHNICCCSSVVVAYGASHAVVAPLGAIQEMCCAALRSGTAEAAERQQQVIDRCMSGGTARRGTAILYCEPASVYIRDGFDEWESNTLQQQTVHRGRATVYKAVTRGSKPSSMSIDGSIIAGLAESAWRSLAIYALGRSRLEYFHSCYPTMS